MEIANSKFFLLLGRGGERWCWGLNLSPSLAVLRPHCSRTHGGGMGQGKPASRRGVNIDFPISCCPPPSASIHRLNINRARDDDWCVRVKPKGSVRVYVHGYARVSKMPRVCQLIRSRCSFPNQKHIETLSFSNYLFIFY